MHHQQLITDLIIGTLREHLENETKAGLLPTCGISHLAPVLGPREYDEVTRFHVSYPFGGTADFGTQTVVFDWLQRTQHLRSGCGGVTSVQP